jgi:hypothetical protein
VRFLAVFAAAGLMPHVEGDARWVLLGMFLGLLIWMLRGIET